MLALALEILHFHKFWATYEHADEVKTIIHSTTLDDKHSIDRLLESSAFDNLFEDYSSFTQQTREGNLSKTARFCMDYVARVNLFHIVDRVVQEYHFHT